MEKFLLVLGNLVFASLVALLSVHAQQAKDASTPHPVVHFEIGCLDIPKTADFYPKMFG